eukprot:Nitzschia sp. Nitz4//scaffold121_size67750//5327//6835//NITZ4_006061-RA/size67750-augustus-gene-0.127-mRNA-1//-1//CDS//3329534330//4135//frame0
MNESPKEQESNQVRQLKERILALEEENLRLKAEFQAKERSDIAVDALHHTGLTHQQIKRYSRQLLLEGGFGVLGQRKLLSSSVLIVGAGGIGSTVILYLAACGIGNITVVDFDQVEESNLHRQVIHKAKDVGMNKADSAMKAISDLNPSIHCEVAKVPFTSSNALEFVEKHDCVIDASDNPLTRYLINDACVLAGKPLVSGSAIGTEGQLTVYNYNNGPCYRCLYPKPNTSEGAKSCSDNGVLGMVPGLVGVLQAVEAVKVLTGAGKVMGDALLMYDSMQCSFLRIKKPPKQPKCPVCGPDAYIMSMEQSEAATAKARGPSCSTNYPRPFVDLPDSNQVSPEEYNQARINGDNHVLLDVRVPEQFHLCGIEGAVNIPLRDLKNSLEEVEKLSDGTKPVYCLCRRGVASASATHILSEALASHPKIHSVINIMGGLDAWRAKVDDSFPQY